MYYGNNIVGKQKYWTWPYHHGSLPIHGDLHFIEMSSTPLKCQAFYCDKQLFSCITFHMDIHLLYLCNVALHPYATKPIPQHLRAQEDASPHCSCMSMHECTCHWRNRPCTNTWTCNTNACIRPTDLFFPQPKTTYWQSPSKCIMEYLQWRQCMSSLVWKLWLWCIGIHGMEWESHQPHNTHQCVMCSLIYFFALIMALPCSFKLPWKSYVRVRIEVWRNMEMWGRDGEVCHCSQSTMWWHCLFLFQLKPNIFQCNHLLPCKVCTNLHMPYLREIWPIKPIYSCSPSHIE